MLTTRLTLAVVGSACVCAALGGSEAAEEKRPHVTMRGIYGGVPTQIFDRGRTLVDYTERILDVLPKLRDNTVKSVRARRLDH
jgi:hypothetical protein